MVIHIVFVNRGWEGHNSVVKVFGFKWDAEQYIIRLNALLVKAKIYYGDSYFDDDKFDLERESLSPEQFTAGNKRAIKQIEVREINSFSLESHKLK